LSPGRAESREVPFHPIPARSTTCCSSKFRTRAERDACCDFRAPWITPSSTVKSNLPSLRFDLVPGNAGQDGVEFGLGDELGPDALHVVEAGGRAVAQFSGPTSGMAGHRRSVGWPCPASASEGYRRRRGNGRLALALTRNQGKRACKCGAK